VLSLQRNSPNTDKHIFENSTIASEFKVYDGPGLNLTVLGVLATHAPNLEELDLSVLACRTPIFVQDTRNLTSFKKLRTLKLTMSLLNWHRPDFVKHEAALFMSTILGLFTRLDLPLLRFDYVARHESLDFEKEYNQFILAFTSQIWNYIQVQACQTARFLSGIDEAESRISRLNLN
jgi:hypothetical protein